MGESPQHAGGDLAGGFVDRHDAAGVQRGFAFVVIAGENFELRMKHGELAGIAVEFHFAEERHLHAFGQHIGEIAAVKPLARQDGARGIGERGLEHAQVAALEPGELGGAHVRDYRGHFAGGKLAR